MDTTRIANMVGHQGEQSGQVYKITVALDDLDIRDMGRENQCPDGTEHLGGLLR